jgi:hypothetical protein
MSMAQRTPDAPPLATLKNVSASARTLPGYVTCVLVFSEPLHRRMPDPAVIGPLGESNLRDQCGFDPVGVSPEPRVSDGRIEGRLPNLDTIEAPPKIPQVGCRPARAGAYLPGPVELRSFVVSDEEGAYGFPGPFWIGEPADDELLTPDAFRFLPVVVSAAPVSRVGAFRDDPFEAQAACRGEKGATAADDMIRKADHAVLAPEQLAQALFAFP